MLVVRFAPLFSLFHLQQHHYILTQIMKHARKQGTQKKPAAASPGASSNEEEPLEELPPLVKVFDCPKLIVNHDSWTCTWCGESFRFQGNLPSATRGLAHVLNLRRLYPDQKSPV